MKVLPQDIYDLEVIPLSSWKELGRIFFLKFHMEEQKATGRSRGVVDVWGSFLFFEPLIEYSLSTEIFLIDKWAVLLSLLTLGEELLPWSKEKLSFPVYLSHENVSLNTFCDAIIQAWSRTTKQALFWERCIFTTGGRKEKDYGGKKNQILCLQQ